ncbi:MAG: hypothetical protein HYR84_11185, partial [Planctomycetes bacterium]|nr:hypothetical protein [Planctomycetota bacterium]
MHTFRAPAFWSGLIFALAAPAYGQPTGGIGAAAIAAYEKLGARFHPAWSEPWAEYDDRERGPKGVPMFTLGSAPFPQTFPAVDAPFGLDFSHSSVTDANLRILADVNNLTALNLRFTSVTAAGLKELARSKSLRWLALSGPDVRKME